MKGFTKLALDLIMGAVVPILILNNLTRTLGAPVAYVLAALVPVVYVLADTFFITRRFNAITTYVALSAILNGILAFWFVDGVLYALKDTAGLAVSVLLFAGSILIGKPMLRFFLVQALNPDTPARRQGLDELMRQPPVSRSLVTATVIVALESVIAGGVNFWLNLGMVTAPFGGETFNQQVAQVNAITRIAFPIASIIAFTLGFALLFRAIYACLPKEEGKSQTDSELWTLVDLWQAEKGAPTVESV
ncbi:MAG: hypothetical protein M1546_24065 [Chloroflexi bacterium]|nr:hypothetical protein [Chloroflexota bacterium]